ncbi:hypothetical protein [Streptomyces sp. NPDC053367]|uniref:hypothetical protein n=1 Tax=Streptomyces sp. NPDC053367 TaxID=3365700 RepID=UPI0037D9275B
MLNDVAAISTGATYSTEAVPVGDIHAGILMVQPTIRCEHGFDVAAYGDSGEMLARACLTGSQVMLHVPFDGCRSVWVEVENVNGYEEHPHAYEITLIPDEDGPHAE